MTTQYESTWAGYMLASLSHCEAGQRIYCGVNAGGTVADGDIISQSSTYPQWYSKLSEVEHGGAIRRNLDLIRQGFENRRAGRLTLGYIRTMKAVQFVMAEGDDIHLVFPCPEYLDELGRHDEAHSLREWMAALAEEAATRPDDPPPPAATLREDDQQIPGKVRAAIPMLAPYASAIEVRGWFTWVIPVDTEALQALLQAGFSRAVKFGGVYGPPEHARKLPVRPCHAMPTVSYQPYH